MFAVTISLEFGHWPFYSVGVACVLYAIALWPRPEDDAGMKRLCIVAGTVLALAGLYGCSQLGGQSGPGPQPPGPDEPDDPDDPSPDSDADFMQAVKAAFKADNGNPEDALDIGSLAMQMGTGILVDKQAEPIIFSSSQRVGEIWEDVLVYGEQPPSGKYPKSAQVLTAELRERKIERGPVTDENREIFADFYHDYGAALIQFYKEN
jgi:hypothetical protein